MNNNPGDPGIQPLGAPSRLLPSSLAKVRELMRSCRQKMGLSQLEFANRFGYSERRYRQMEIHGDISIANMHALARQLEMSPSVRAQFFFFLTGEVPVRGLTIDEMPTVGEGMKRVAAGWARVHVYAQADPAVLIDGCWNVEHFNEPWYRIFENVRSHHQDHPLVNPMRFGLFHPEAPQIFLDWKESWVVTALCRFSQRYYMNRDNAELQEVRERIRRNPFLEEIYTRRVGRELAERGIDRLTEGDVQERPLLVPGKGEQTILVTMMAPWFGRHSEYEVVAFSRPDSDEPLMEPPPTRELASCEPYRQPDEVCSATAQTAPPPGDSPPPGRSQPDTEFALTVGKLLLEYRKKTPYSQDQFTHFARLPISNGLYARIERDKQPPKKEILPDLGRALKMPLPVRQLLYSLATQAEPPTLSVSGGPETEKKTQRWVRIHLASHRQKAPAVLMDGAWNVKFCNDAFRELFAHVPAHPRNHPTINPFRYVVFHKEAQSTLAEWYDVWLTPWLVELGSALLHNRDNPHPEHVDLYDEIEQDPFLRDVFHGRVMRDLRGAGTTVGFESDGDLRGMHLPVQEADGTSQRRYTPMLVTAGVPLHLKKTGELFTTMTPREPR
ncbi:hypothetical protein ACH4VR_29115 [Streptomyces sp. NPDC020883]|uniref:hypothetical protein n=1 Tax=Streptomyces sp. NPDC020883 TaxID=3365099 RepID=UPI0037A312A2